MRIIQIDSSEDLVQIRAMPSREAIAMRNPERKAIGVDETIARGEPILFCVLRQFKLRAPNHGTRYILYGSLQDGRKCSISAEEIAITVDIRLPEKYGGNLRAFAEVIRGMIDASYKFHATKMEKVKLLPSRMFHAAPVDYLRVYFHSTENHYEFVRNVDVMWDPAKQGGVKLDLGDDDSNYYHKVARTNQHNTAGWNLISNYRQVEEGDFSVGCSYYLAAPIANIRPADQPSSAANCPPYFIESWDIETYKSGTDGLAPVATDDFEVTVISNVYGWNMSLTPELTAAITHWPGGSGAAGQWSGPDPQNDRMDYLICCATPALVLAAKLALTGHMRADFVTGYNTEKFDWPNTIRKLDDYNLVNEFEKAYSHGVHYGDSTMESILKFQFRSFRVKIDAETDVLVNHVPQFRGSVDVDVKILVNRAYPRDPNGSLDYWLKFAKLDGKADMIFLRMFRIYERMLAFHSLPDEFRTCHCPGRCPTGQTSCPLCPVFDRYVDGVRDETIIVDNYTATPLPEIRDKCCRCGKYEQNVQDMLEVALYCTIDSVRNYQLLQRLQFIANAQSLANVTFTDMHEGLYAANGRKVANFVGAVRFDNGVSHSSRCPNQYGDPPTYNQGAYILEPAVGSVNRTEPQAITDVNSLYPNVAITHNISHEKEIPAEQVEHFRRLGYTVNEVGPFQIETGHKKGDARNKWKTVTGYYISHVNVQFTPGETHTAHQFQKVIHYTSPEGRVVTATCDMDKIPLDQLGETPESKLAARAGWKRRVEYRPVLGRKALVGEELGVIPKVLLRLIAMRRKVQARMAEIAEKMETATSAERALLELLYELDKILQNIIKIVANSVYGALGMFLGSLYSETSGGGVTWGGRTVLQVTEKLITDLRCQAKYGDTDSLMITLPAQYYEGTEAQYQEWCRQYDTPPDNPDPKYKLLESRMSLMAEECDKYVSGFLIEKIADTMVTYSRSLYLKMVCEKIGSPWGYSSKKRYFMMPYSKRDGKWLPNLPKRGEAPDSHIYKRGYDVVKQNVPNIVKTLGASFFLSAVDLYKQENVKGLVRRLIVEFHETELNVLDAIRYATFRPTRANPSVQLMVKLLRQYLETATDPIDRDMHSVPDGGAKFPYLVIDRGTSYSLTGLLHHPTIGECMMQYKTFEYLRRTGGNVKINKDYYMNNVLSGTFAQFIVGDPEFDPTPAQLVQIQKWILNPKITLYSATTRVRAKNAKRWVTGVYSQVTGRADQVKLAKTHGAELRHDYHDAERWLRGAMAGQVTLPAIQAWMKVVTRDKLMPFTSGKILGIVRGNATRYVEMLRHGGEMARRYRYMARQDVQYEFRFGTERLRTFWEGRATPLVEESAPLVPEWQKWLRSFMDGVLAPLPEIPKNIEEMGRVALHLAAVEIRVKTRQMVMDHLVVAQSRLIEAEYQ